MRIPTKMLGMFLISILTVGIPALAVSAGNPAPLKTDESPYWYKPGSGPLPLPSEKFAKMDDAVRMHNQKGIDAFLAREFEKSLDHFEIANKLDPDNGVLSFNQGMALHRLERHREAAIKFEEAKRNANGNQLILGSPTLHAHLKKMD